MTEFTTWRSLVDGAEISAIPDSVIDNFEDADANPAGLYSDEDTVADFWPHDNGHDAMNRSDENVAVGGHSLRINADTSDVSIPARWSVPSDETLPRYVEPGDTVKVLMRDDSDRIRPSLGVMVDGSENPDCYAVRLRGDEDEVAIRKGYSLADDDPRDGATSLSTESPSLNSGDWYWVEYQLPDEDNDEHQVDVYELDGEDRGDQVTTVTANDDELIEGDGVALIAESGSGDTEVIDEIEILDD